MLYPYYGKILLNYRYSSFPPPPKKGQMTGQFIAFLIVWEGEGAHTDTFQGFQRYFVTFLYLFIEIIQLKHKLIRL